jgi:regulator of sigma E protease
MILSILITLVAFFIILSVLVLVHELGHYGTAKLSGVKVEEFGLGYPPKLYGYKYKDTMYSINAIPFGGFTKMLGEEDPMFPGSLASKSHATRFMVLVAGSVMNILLPIVLFSIGFMIPHDTLTEKVRVTDVSIGSPAQVMGIEKDDIILKINNRTVNNRSDLSYETQLNLGNPINIVLQKPDLSQKMVTVTPRWKTPQGEGAIGIMMKGENSVISQESLPFWEAIPKGSIHCWEILTIYRNEIAGWFIRGNVPQLTGPVGIVQLTGEVAKAGFAPLLELAAIISISLGIFNLFPFPGLDGGRIVFVAIEWVRRGKRISPKVEGIIHMIGFALLIGLMLVVSYFDILRFIQGDNILP